MNNKSNHINTIDYRELREGNRIMAKSPEKNKWVERAIYSWHYTESLKGKKNNVHIKPLIVTKELLIELGFESDPISMSKDISRFKDEYKRLVVDGCDMMAIRQGGKRDPRSMDDLVVLHNSDIDGKLSVHKLQNVYYLLTGKEIDFK